MLHGNPTFTIWFLVDLRCPTAPRFLEGQAYLADMIHPNREVGLEIANIYLNYVEQLKVVRMAHPDWAHPSVSRVASGDVAGDVIHDGDSGGDRGEDGSEDDDDASKMKTRKMQNHRKVQ